MPQTVRVHRISSLLGAAALAAALSSCATAPTPAGSEVNPTPDVPASAAVTCEAFGDVATIIGNADAALADGRMETQERDGWYRLATRVLDRVPMTGTSAVDDAVQELKEAAPAIKLGAIGNVDFQSMKWADGKQALLEACAAEGVDLASEAFTGG